MNYKTLTTEDSCTCLECGSFFRGRTDKRFCDDRCRNRYNNRKNNSSRHIRNKTIGILTSNYEILDGLIKRGISSISLIEITELGFRPDFHTSHRKGTYGHNECCCFDIVYCQSSSKIFKMRKILVGQPQAKD